MAKPDSRDPRQLRRRDALRLLAASGTAVGTSLIISQPAFADSGSTACRYDFGGSPQVAIEIRNRGGNQSDTLSMSVSGVGGTCPCGGGAAIEYSYFVVLPGIGQGGTGWISSSTVSVTSPSVLWPDSGGSVTVAVGIRVTCAAVVGEAIRCRYASATYAVGPANYSTTEFLSLPNNNGNNPPPTGLPACDPALQRSAFQVLSGGSGAVIGFVPGLLPEPLDDPLDDLGVEPRTPVEGDLPADGASPANGDPSAEGGPSTTSPTRPTATPATTAPPSSATQPTSLPSTTTPPSTTPPSTTPPPTTPPPTTTAPVTAPPATTVTPPTTSIPAPPAGP